MGFKTASIFIGDSIQRFALRNMGDAGRWVDIANLNNLAPPYIVDNAVDATPGVAYAGQLLLIPVPADNSIADTLDPFLTDLALPAGELQVVNGDWSLVSGAQNLVQALINRVQVRKTSLWFHPEYGCLVQDLLGATNGPATGRLAAFYVKSSIVEDPRVTSVPNINATVIGDSTSIDCVVQPTYGESIAYEQTF